jgi:hypothetical protein
MDRRLRTLVVVAFMFYVHTVFCCENYMKGPWQPIELVESKLKYQRRR